MTATKEIKQKVAAKRPANAKPDTEEPQDQAPAKQIKIIGGGRPKSKRFEFGLVAYRNDEEEVHEFTARKMATTQDAVALILAAESGTDTVDLLPQMARMLRKSMVDDDGTPLGWSALDHMLAEDHAAFDADDPRYEGPDGVVHSLSDGDTLRKFLARESGSSRARWVHLMEHDEDADVELADITQVVKEIISRTAGRPSAP